MCNRVIYLALTIKFWSKGLSKKKKFWSKGDVDGQRSCHVLYCSTVVGYLF